MTATTTLALIRHGQTSWSAAFRIQGRTDIPLNDVGREQAQAAVEALRAFDIEWHAVATSPLSRALETAQILTEGLSLPDPLTVDGLTERDYGQAEGLTGAELDRVRSGKGFLDAEEEHEVAARGIEALELLRKRYSGKNVIAVSHGMFIRATLSSLFSVELPGLGNTSISLARHNANGWSLISANNVPGHRLAKISA